MMLFRGDDAPSVSCTREESRDGKRFLEASEKQDQQREGCAKKEQKQPLVYRHFTQGSSLFTAMRYMECTDEGD
jgi:hypothetical protein